MKSKLMIEYAFEVSPLAKPDGGGYLISFPDLPGCISDGATPEEAIKNGRDALKSWLSVAEEFGGEVPPPAASVSGRFVQRLPRSLHARLITRAKAEGVSLNTLVVSLVSQGIGQKPPKRPRQVSRKSVETTAGRSKVTVGRAKVSGSR